MNIFSSGLKGWVIKEFLLSRELTGFNSSEGLEFFYLVPSNQLFLR